METAGCCTVPHLDSSRSTMRQTPVQLNPDASLFFSKLEICKLLFVSLPTRQMDFGISRLSRLGSPKLKIFNHRLYGSESASRSICQQVANIKIDKRVVQYCNDFNLVLWSDGKTVDRRALICIFFNLSYRKLQMSSALLGLFFSNLSNCSNSYTMH